MSHSEAVEGGFIIWNSQKCLYARYILVIYLSYDNVCRILRYDRDIPVIRRGNGNGGISYDWYMYLSYHWIRHGVI
jgi:hypothetical protein